MTRTKKKKKLYHETSMSMNLMFPKATFFCLVLAIVLERFHDEQFENCPNAFIRVSFYELLLMKAK